jgi:hypothetical protein
MLEREERGKSGSQDFKQAKNIITHEPKKPN